MATASPAENRSAASWLKWIWASKIGIGTPTARAAEGSSAAAAEVARKRRREIMAGLLPAGIFEPCHSRRLRGKPTGRFPDCVLRDGASLRGPFDRHSAGFSDRSSAPPRDEAEIVQPTELSPTMGAGRRQTRPWQCLYFLPDPQGQGALRETLPQVAGIDGRGGSVHSVINADAAGINRRQISATDVFGPACRDAVHLHRSRVDVLIPVSSLCVQISDSDGI